MSTRTDTNLAALAETRRQLVAAGVAVDSLQDYLIGALAGHVGIATFAACVEVARDCAADAHRARMERTGRTAGRGQLTIDGSVIGQR